MTALLIGARRADACMGLGSLGIDYDVVADPAENPAKLLIKPRQIFTLRYFTDPTSVLSLPRLDEYRAILSFTEGGLYTAALVAKAVGLPGPAPEAVARTRNKHLMRSVLRRHGFPQPAFGIVGVRAPAAQDFPVIVKPVAGSGSAGVRRVDTSTHYAEIAPDGATMWESYLDGPHFTVEGVHDGNGFQALSVIAERISPPPYFVVLEHQSPAAISAADRDLLVDAVEQSLSALGVRDAITHTEVRLCGRTPVLVETHTRPAGDTVPLITRLTTGWDHFELGVRVGYVGKLPARPPVPTATVARTLHFTRQDSDPATLADPAWLREFPQVAEWEFRGVERSESDPRWAHVVLTADSYDDLDLTGQAIRRRARGRTVLAASQAE